MLLTLAALASAASLVDFPADSPLAPHQLLMHLTLAVPALAVPASVVPVSVDQAVQEVSAPQDKAHQPQMPQHLMLPQLTSQTNPRSPDDDDRHKSVLFGQAAEPIVVF